MLQYGFVAGWYHVFYNELKVTSVHIPSFSRNLLRTRGLPRACDGDPARDIRRTAMYAAFHAVSATIATRHTTGT